MDYVKHASTSPMKNVFYRFHTIVQNLAPNMSFKKRGILKFFVKFLEAVFGPFIKVKVILTIPLWRQTLIFRFLTVHHDKVI